MLINLLGVGVLGTRYNDELQPFNPRDRTMKNYAYTTNVSRGWLTPKLVSLYTRS